ncbi:MAG: hypothetical protein QG597_956, partial [Actinomycetota bacterium]|nr:hypothetical protein [Actinomycetota bacterium]
MNITNRTTPVPNDVHGVTAPWEPGIYYGSLSDWPGAVWRTIYGLCPTCRDEGWDYTMSCLVAEGQSGWVALHHVR